MLRLEQLSKRYGETLAVRSLSLEVAAGELLALIGESGSGKTTALKMINRLIEPTSGRVMLQDQDASAMDPVTLRRGIGYVFQGIGLFPHWSVAENVAAVPRLLNWDEAKTQARVDELLNLVGLAPQQYRDRLPAELSGGQQQRVGVARALAGQPRLLLMDEPFGALDPLTRDTLQQELRRLHRELQLTIVLVTHDISEALLLADRIAVLRNGELLAVGSPHELLTSASHEYVVQLLAGPKRKADEIEALAAGTAW